MAFDEFNSIGNNEIDWSRMIKRNIFMKAETIFNARGWNTTKLYEICEIKREKEDRQKDKKEEER